MAISTSTMVDDEEEAASKVADASDKLWVFIEAVCNSTHDVVTRADVFRWFAQHMSNAFVISEGAFLPWEDVVATSLDHCGAGMPVGWSFCVYKRRYEMCDMDAFFWGLEAIGHAVQSWMADTNIVESMGYVRWRTDKMVRCVRKMAGVIDVNDLADRFMDSAI